MSETLLVLIISLAFGGVVYYFSNRYEKKNEVNIYSKVWGIVACLLVWVMWFLTDDFLDIGSK